MTGVRFKNNLLKDRIEQKLNEVFILNSTEDYDNVIVISQKKEIVLKVYVALETPSSLIFYDKSENCYLIVENKKVMLLQNGNITLYQKIFFDN